MIQAIIALSFREGQQQQLEPKILSIAQLAHAAAFLPATFCRRYELFFYSTIYACVPTLEPVQCIKVSRSVRSLVVWRNERYNDADSWTPKAIRKT